jgi:hypothetical protein
MYDITDLTEEHRAVWDWLVSHCAGRTNAQPRATLLGSYNTFHVVKLSDRKFRQLVSDLVLQFHLPVCPTSADGYFVARYPEDLEHGIAELKARGAAILARQRALEQALSLEPQRRLF